MILILRSFFFCFFRVNIGSYWEKDNIDLVRSRFYDTRLVWWEMKGDSKKELFIDFIEVLRGVLEFSVILKMSIFSIYKSLVVIFSMLRVNWVKKKRYFFDVKYYISIWKRISRNICDVIFLFGKRVY